MKDKGSFFLLFRVLSIKTYSSFINVTGYKLVQSVCSDKVKVYCNGSEVEVRVQGSFSLNTDYKDQKHGTINKEYAPAGIIPNNCRTNNQVHFTIFTDGRLVTNNFSNISNLTLFTVFHYAKK